MDNKSIGFLGLGNMGKNMVFNLLDKGYEVYAWNRSEEPRKEVAERGAKAFESIPDLIEALPNSPKVVWSMVSAGDPVDSIIEQLINEESTERKLNEGDIFIDGVNSHFEDSLRRGALLKQRGIRFLDCGVSGGIEGARNGACIMVGGDKSAYDYTEEIIKDMATEKGFGYFGNQGAGHYVKMVHNAIEYGMMQAISEGINLLEVSDYDVDYETVTEVWNHGSIITGNLMGFLNDAFKKDKKLDNIDPEIGSLGTGRWAVEHALKLGVPFNTIANAVFSRYSSRNTDIFSYKTIQAMRIEFGGHNSKERAHK